MGTTANNNWPTPVASDLVKDGWEAIKDLGDAIDTTLGVYAPSTSGLTLSIQLVLVEYLLLLYLLALLHQVTQTIKLLFLI
jgi:hypothetical protein